MARPEQMQEFWDTCRDHWLEKHRKRSQKTYLAYALADNEFGIFRREHQPPLDFSCMTPAYVFEWMESMQKSGVSGALGNQRLSAISSLYDLASTFCVEGSTPLWNAPNPFREISRFVVGPLQRPALTANELRRLFDAISFRNATGVRDAGLLLGLVVTLRRPSEWLPLRQGDIFQDGDVVYFNYAGRGGQIHTQQMPEELLNVITLYLKMSRRWPLSKDDFVFVALQDSAQRLHDGAGNHFVSAGYKPDNQPLSNKQTLSTLKRYGKRAGIAPEKLTLESLRRAGAQLRHERGVHMSVINEILGHASIAATRAYLHNGKIECAPDPYAGQIFTDIMPPRLQVLSRSVA